MADYRELSQEYAHGGIKAAMLLNGGAAVAALSQLSKFFELGLGFPAALAIIFWAIGVLVGAVTWVLGFLSTRFVDRADRESGSAVDEELQRSDWYMHAGL